jgi:MYXO-CTERM domain-containing protein
MARGPLQVRHGSACSVMLDAGYTRLRFTPAPELVPFLPWVHWRLEVDGEGWAEAQHGEVLAEGTVHAPVPGPFVLLPRTLFQVHANCGGSTESGDLGLKPGRHHATLRATLANAPGTLPPVELDFELSCQDTPPEPTPDEPSERPSGFGCSHAGGTGTGALLGLFALGALVWRQTRRISRAR